MQANARKIIIKPRQMTLFRCEIEQLYYFRTLFCVYDGQGAV